MATFPKNFIKNNRDISSNFVTHNVNSRISTSGFLTVLKKTEYLKTIQGLIKRIVDQ